MAPHNKSLVIWALFVIAICAVFTFWSYIQVPLVVVGIVWGIVAGILILGFVVAEVIRVLRNKYKKK